MEFGQVLADVWARSSDGAKHLFNAAMAAISIHTAGPDHRQPVPIAPVSHRSDSLFTEVEAQFCRASSPELPVLQCHSTSTPIHQAPTKKVKPKKKNHKKKGVKKPKKKPVRTDAAMLASVNKEFGTKVNFNALSDFEGSQLTNGYIPKNKKGEVLGKSGVTVATGFDIGQHSADSIKAMGLPKDLQDKLLPYAGLKKKDAIKALDDNPLTITKEEADLIDQSSHRAHLRSAVDSWNSNKPDDAPSFSELTEAQQTVIFSRTFHQGPGMPDTKIAHDFYTAAQEGKWEDAETALRDYDTDQQWYKTRVNSEADLLKREREKTAATAGAGATQ